LKEEYTLQVKSLSELKVSELWKEIKVTEEVVWGDLKLEAQFFLRRILEGSMEEEVMDYIGISRKYERSEERETLRNGYYKRDLETELGLVRELEVPRTRDGGLSDNI
jgi:transposase-like protein